ncbi:DUF4238 domain-containing protein [Streptomyces erythrochromogenes]|uniref:DUF4238 domain-containing protein n=1 Tax=Streptomyces erythrochromogenes TaxID=285574 RepID=UPI0002DEB4FB
MGQSKKHHFVPQMYLRNFADDKDRTQVVRLATKRSTTERINTVAATNHFHRLTVGDEESLHLEDAATALEGRAAQPMLRLIDPSKRVWPLPREERMTLAFFIAFQYLRVPVKRDALSSLAAQLPEIFGGDLPEELRELDIPIMHAMSMVGAALPEGAAELCNRTWWIVDFKRKRLATSDVPVIPLPDENTTERSAAGLRSPGGVYFPLSPQTALFIGPPRTAPEADQIVPGNARLARQFTTATLAWTRDCLFHHPDDDPLRGYTLPEPRRGEIRWEVWGGPEPDQPQPATA